MRAIWIGAVVLAAGALCAPTARAGEAWDEVELKNGRVLSGSVTRKGAYYEVRRSHGSLLIPVRDVREVTFTNDPLDELARMRAAGFARGTADQRFRYATLLARLGKRREFTRVYQSVLRVDPNHPGANLALGRVFHDGTWMTAWERDRVEAAKKRAQGFVLYRGSWLLPAERDRRVAKAAKEAARQRAADEARAAERRRAQALEDARETARLRVRAQEAEVQRLKAQAELEQAQAQRAVAERAAAERLAVEREAERARLRARRLRRERFLNGRGPYDPTNRARYGSGYCPPQRGSDRRPRVQRRGSDRRSQPRRGSDRRPQTGWQPTRWQPTGWKPTRWQPTRTRTQPTRTQPTRTQPTQGTGLALPTQTRLPLGVR